MTDKLTSDKVMITDIKISVNEKLREEYKTMKINNNKLQIALAVACMNPYDLCKEVGIQYQTYRRITNEKNCKTATLGKIAKALEVDVTELIAE